MSDYGPEIEVNGVRPEWLRNADRIMFQVAGDEGWYGPTRDDFHYWKNIVAIRLPSDHPYYTVVGRNAKHPDERPFEYWPGGETEPADWDRGDVLLADGKIVGGTTYWQRTGAGRDIIGYRRAKPLTLPRQAPDIAAIGAELTEPERERLLGWRGVWGAAYNAVSEDLMERGLLDRAWNHTPLGECVAEWLRKQNVVPEGDTVTLKRMTVEELNALYEEWVMSPEADELATIWLARRLGLLASDPVPQTLPEPAVVAPEADTVALKRMTRDEVKALYEEWSDNTTPFDNEDASEMLFALHKLGLLAFEPLPETLLERFSSETGRKVTPELVAFAEWMEGRLP